MEEARKLFPTDAHIFVES